MDDLLKAIAAAGLSLPGPPASLAELNELNAELSPRRLPEDLEAFWRRVEVRSLPISAYPTITGPDWALRTLRSQREDSVPVPAAFVDVGYESWNCMSVDVDDGAVYDWRLDTDAVWRRFDRFQDWLSHLANLIRSGAVSREEYDGDVYLVVEDPEDDLAMNERGYPEIPRDPARWPPRWRR